MDCAALKNQITGAALAKAKIEGFHEVFAPIKQIVFSNDPPVVNVVLGGTSRPIKVNSQGRTSKEAVLFRNSVVGLGKNASTTTGHDIVAHDVNMDTLYDGLLYDRLTKESRGGPTWTSCRWQQFPDFTKMVIPTLLSENGFWFQGTYNHKRAMRQ